VHTNEYIDLGYLDEKMFIMCWFGMCEFVPRHNQYVINVYNNMHVGYKIKVEWKIAGF